MFRRDARTYAADPLARAVAARAVARGFDQNFAPAEQTFFYLPFEHSEDIADQERGLALFRATGDAELIKYAQDHVGIIRRLAAFRIATRSSAATLRRRSRPSSKAAASPVSGAPAMARNFSFVSLTCHFRSTSQQNVKRFLTMIRLLRDGRGGWRDGADEFPGAVTKRRLGLPVLIWRGGADRES